MQSAESYSSVCASMCVVLCLLESLFFNSCSCKMHSVQVYDDKSSCFLYVGSKTCILSVCVCGGPICFSASSPSPLVCLLLATIYLPSHLMVQHIITKSTKLLFFCLFYLRLFASQCLQPLQCCTSGLYTALRDCIVDLIATGVTHRCYPERQLCTNILLWCQGGLVSLTLMLFRDAWLFCQSNFGPDWISQQLFDGSSWSFVQTFMTHTQCILMTLMSSWLFL